MLQTKLFVPHDRSDEYIQRTRLTSQLEHGSQQRFTLISAPAGFGKTSLVAEWIRQYERAAAWLSLDETDNEPTRFLAYLVAAIQTVDHSVGEIVDRLIQQSSLPPKSYLLIPLLNGIAHRTKPLVLVLNDYHLIHDPTCHSFIKYLLNNAPPQLRLFILTRQNPPISFGRLRMEGQLFELSEQDLAFSETEATNFLNRAMGLELKQSELATLVNRSEGWIAGLQMAALSLRQMDPEHRSDFIVRFAGSHPHLMDYLVEEVLSQQTPEIQRFLMMTSVLERICLPLCEALVGDDLVKQARPSEFDQASDLLTSLAQANLFLTSLDEERYWYRYHALFRDCLRVRYMRNHPDELPEVYCKAAEWHVAAGYLADAIQLGFASEDMDWVASLIAQKADTLWRYQDMLLLQEWLLKIPLEVKHRHPKLLLTHAWSAHILGDMSLAHRLLIEFDAASLDYEVDAEQKGIRALVEGALLREHDSTAAVVLYREAKQLLPDVSASWRASADIGLGFALMEQGALDESLAVFSMARSANRLIGNIHAVLFIESQIGTIQFQQGYLQRAHATFQSALDRTDANDELTLMRAWPQLGMAMILLERNQLSDAAEATLKAIELAKQSSDRKLLVNGYVLLAFVQMTTGETASASALLNLAEQIADEASMATLQKQVELAFVQFYLRTEKTNQLQSWVNKLELPSMILQAHARFEEILLAGRVLIVRGQLSTARQLLDATKTQLRDPHDRRFFKIDLHRALLFAVDGKQREAVQLIEQLLPIAEQENLQRTFLNLGEPMETLLRSVALHPTKRGFLKTLLAAFDAVAPPIRVVNQALIEPMSQTELAILAHLAAGLSNQQIAEERTVAISTIKWHLKNIYGKLQVSSRTAAIARARELALLC
ncbi:LuxR C-terminal-related transcriptional regulator [Chloroflexi bacterium TSY]|nr:LuxR C-terminal-related transcriptional regulator [Chloroflexi bacterium TSY]